MSPLQTVIKSQLAKIGFIQTWRYVLPADFKVEILNPGIDDFHSEYFRIYGNTITVKRGYAWNGCNPAYLYRLPFSTKEIWIGTPDGPVDESTGLPQSWKASLIHDCFCQYRFALSGVTKEFTVDLFEKLLLECGFESWRSKLYSRAVKWFGPQKWY